MIHGLGRGHCIAAGQHKDVISCIDTFITRSLPTNYWERENVDLTLDLDVVGSTLRIDDVTGEYIPNLYRDLCHSMRINLYFCSPPILSSGPRASSQVETKEKL